MIVAKFGGSTLKKACDFKTINSIIERRPDIKFVVVSACKGVTDQLIKISSCPFIEREAHLSAIINFHKDIINSLYFNSDELSNYLYNIKNETKKIISSNLSPIQLDQLLSIGERLSSAILTNYLRSCGHKVTCLDARKLIITDDNFGIAQPIIDKTKEACQAYIRSQSSGSLFITQGFIGSTENGLTTTLGREGSDYSAALIAAAFAADELDFYKDVGGVYAHDPRITPDAQLFKRLNYHEMLKISSLGSNILHFSAIKLCQDYNIPINIRSIFIPHMKGTLIKDTEKKAS